MTETKLLLQTEVAERLRCSEVKVKRLRLSGQLPYLPGRPVLIRESDLEAYVESQLARKQPTREAAAVQGENRDTVEAAARRWALQAVLFQRKRTK